MLTSIGRAAMIGATIGLAVAIIMLSLEYARLFSPPVAALIERLTFRLCPLYILGFASGIGSFTLVITKILGNAILYGTVLGALALIVKLLRRRAAFN